MHINYIKSSSTVYTYCHQAPIKLRDLGALEITCVLLLLLLLDKLHPMLSIWFVSTKQPAMKTDI